MTRIRETSLLLAALVFASASAFAQGTYTQIDVPGSLATFCYGIDAAGDIVGGYVDAADIYHGFLLSGGTYTTIDYPGGESTQANGINDVGQIVGYTFLPGSNRYSTGFTYAIQTQTFTEINIPGAQGTYAQAINNAGTVGGFILNSLSNQVGFERFASGHGIPVGFYQGYSFVAGVAASNEAVGGFYSNDGTFFNFSFNGRRYRLIEIPETFAQVYGVNPAGTLLVGSDETSVGHSTGFVDQNSTLTTLQFPGSDNTFAYGINDAGDVAGYFNDSSGNPHGYMWTPPAGAEKK